MAETRSRLVFDIQVRTIFKIAAAIALLWCLWQLYALILLLIVAVILAVALDVPVSWLERQKFSRTNAALLVSTTLVVIVGAFVWLTWSTLTSQWQYLTTQLPKTISEAGRYLPSWMYTSLTGRESQAALESFGLRVGQSLAYAGALIVLGFFVMVYLLIDAERTRAWIVAFFPQRRREQVERTMAESREVIWAYAVGNVVTSICATVVTLIGLIVLDVPAALLLALIAGISDFVPVVGFILSLLPAAALALLVSPQTTMITIVLYIAYNTIENYFISPWAYGKQLQLSNLAVVIAFAVGAELAGVIGALIALPVAALYPTVERIWLREQLPHETVSEHTALTRSPRAS
ncbi:MAG TPA: AI-2E family transporter [Vicinamibacterales bacterium]|nr:AI-2E family transporter [Vicinamibacterales bacterium]